MHPDQPEHICGADMIYEQIDPRKNSVKFIFLQYKTWNKDGVIYFSETKNLLPQLSKLSGLLCNGGFCKCSSAVKNEFRFPHCSAFLRPTDKLQYEDSKMISTGIHIPICEVQKISSTDSKIEKKQFSNNSLSHRVFEELFNNNFIGSDWIPFAQCEDFYKKHLIMDTNDTIRLVAREFIEY